MSGLAENFARASGQDFRTAAASLVDSYAHQVASLAQSFAPVDTGALPCGTSISISRPSPLDGDFIGPHVAMTSTRRFGTRTRGEFGGAAYDIHPKKPGGMLKFQVGGKTVYARVVHNPGVRPHPYMRPAFERVVTPFGTSLAAQLAGSAGRLRPVLPRPPGIASVAA